MWKGQNTRLLRHRYTDFREISLSMCVCVRVRVCVCVCVRICVCVCVVNKIMLNISRVKYGGDASVNWEKLSNNTKKKERNRPIISRLLSEAEMHNL